MSPPMPEVQSLLLGEGGLGPEGPAFEAWCAAHSATRCRLWLGAEVECPLLAEPGARFARPDGLADYARRVLGHYEVAVEGAPVAGWRSRSRVGASLLVPPADLAAIEAVAARHALQVVGVHPLWAGALALALRERPALLEHAWLLVVQRRVVTALELRDGGIVQLRRHWLEGDEAAQLGWLVEELSAAGRTVVAAGFGLQGPPPQALRVLGRLDGDGPECVRRLGQALPAAGARWSAPFSPDFAARPQARRPLAGWALALTGALVLALAAGDAASAWAQRREALAGASGPVVAADRPPATQRAAAAAPDADARALERLAYPWERLFGVGESARPDPGGWLAFEHRAAQPTLSLRGVTSGPDEALAVTAAMARAAALADATLTRSEPREGGGVRFEIVARVAPRGTP